MEMSTLWKQSTGSSIWGGGLVLAREMETLGPTFFEGKHVLELGSGTGLGAITAGLEWRQTIPIYDSTTLFYYTALLSYCTTTRADWKLCPNPPSI